jgi:hypothetical protein
MYPRNFAGVVISDQYTDAPRIVVADDPFTQVYRAQAYGDDDIRDGAEGLGMVQAQRLKAKLGARRRRLRVGRDGFGVAPLAVAGAAKAAGLSISLKKPSPRVFGGPLTSTVEGIRSRVERGDLSAIQSMDNARKTAKDKAAWQRIWTELLPTWRYAPQMYALIKSRDPSFPGQPPVPAGAATGPAIAPPAKTGNGNGLVLFPAVPAPAPGPVVDATGFPAPFFPPVPSPISPAAGGGTTASETVAAASANGEGVNVVQAGMLGGLDLKSPMTMLMLAGAGLFVVAQFAGTGSRRRRSRR